jgi:alpha-mannosidase
MLKRTLAGILTFVVGAGFAAAASERPAESIPDRPDSKKDGHLRIISSSHQDIAWMDSPERCRDYRDVSCITPALEMMAKNPDYCFVMENMLNLMEYLERHPDRKADILRYTKEGRLEWGATFNQPYESLLSGEQLVRQTYFGRRWIRTNLPGCDALVYFNPDVPGRALQMQQILSKAGIPFMVISRFHEGFYRWAAPDGSSVVAYSPGHYTNSSALLNAAPAEAARAIAQKIARWDSYYRQRDLAPEFPLLNSVDFSKPTDFSPLIELWNNRSANDSAGPRPKMMYSSARGFFEALVQGTPRLDRVMGERPNLWLYIHGPTHHWAITAQREAGFLLPAAEIFGTVDALLAGGFAGYPARLMEEAWMAAIYPDHGWGGKEGQITDRLFRKKYEFARDKGMDMLTAALAGIGARIRTDAAKGVPLVIFNSLSWPRTDPVEAVCPAPGGGFSIKDIDGKDVPFQILPFLPDQESGTVHVGFIAEDIPPIGYRTYYLAEKDGPKTAAPSLPAPPAGSVFENRFYRIEFAPGGLKSVFDKEMKCELLETGRFLGFEVFTMQSVGNGAGEFGRVQQPTLEGFDKLSAHRPVWEFDAAASEQVRTVFRFKRALADVTVEEKIILFETVKRIDCEVSLIGWDGRPYREFRLALPVAAPGGKVAYEVPMGVVEVGAGEAAGPGGPAYGSLVYDERMSDIRPREVQNFISVSDGRLGLTLSTSVAVNDYRDPTGGPDSFPVLQAILLASRRSCHGEGNWYLQEGDHAFRFSITSHEPGWRNGYRRGIQANVPPFAVIAPSRGGNAALPETMSFFSLSAPNLVISTIKKAEDDDAVVLRCYDIEGRAAEVRIESFFPIAGAALTNMIEDQAGPLSVKKGAIVLKVGPYAIETVKFRSGRR